MKLFVKKSYLHSQLYINYYITNKNFKISKNTKNNYALYFLPIFSITVICSSNFNNKAVLHLQIVLKVRKRVLLPSIRNAPPFPIGSIKI